MKSNLKFSNIKTGHTYEVQEREYYFEIHLYDGLANTFIGSYFILKEIAAKIDKAIKFVLCKKVPLYENYKLIKYEREISLKFNTHLV